MAKSEMNGDQPPYVARSPVRTPRATANLPRRLDGRTLSALRQAYDLPRMIETTAASARRYLPATARTSSRVTAS